MLSYSVSEKDKTRLESEVNRLVGKDEMGEIYKFFYIGKKENGKLISKTYFNIFFKEKSSLLSLITLKYISRMFSLLKKKKLKQFTI